MFIDLDMKGQCKDRRMKLAYSEPPRLKAERLDSPTVKVSKLTPDGSDSDLHLALVATLEKGVALQERKVRTNDRLRSVNL